MKTEETLSSSAVSQPSSDFSALINYTLHLADNALILGHRNSEWTGHGPILEQDIALSNIALDLIGQSRNFYQYAAELLNDSPHPSIFQLPYNRAVTEDDLAYLRDAWDFKNCLLVEQLNGDWGQTILRQFLFSTFQYYFYQQLQRSSDTRLASIAEKSLKETTYHLRWSSEWLIRLGDGTEESHQRMMSAVDNLWMYTTELFQPAGYETKGVEQAFAVDVCDLQNAWQQKVQAVFDEATLSVPTQSTSQHGGKDGIHSEHLGFLLAEMQFLQRAYPNATW